jgi:thioredoxin 1
MKKFNDLINSDKPVLVDFSATWCGPCHAMAVVLKELKLEVKDTVTIVKVDIYRNQAASNYNGVRSVPTFML